MKKSKREKRSTKGIMVFNQMENKESVQFNTQVKEERKRKEKEQKEKKEEKKRIT